MNGQKYLADRDLTTGRLYLYQQEGVLRDKCAALLIWSLGGHLCRESGKGM
jgi:hypothetical protein